MAEGPAGRGLKFRESMPRPLLVAFLVAAAAALGLVVWLFVRPPVPRQLDLGSRRSPPVGALSHDVVGLNPVAIPTPLPAFTPPCEAVAGVVIEGGEPAQGRVGFILRRLCAFAGDPFQPPELRRSVGGLAGARIRFAVFSSTGNQSTTDLAARRVYLSYALARTNVRPETIWPLLVHEGWHLATGTPVTAAREYGARVAEAQACRLLPNDLETPRGCLDAQAIVALGETRAVELLVSAGFPR